MTRPSWSYVVSDSKTLEPRVTVVAMGRSNSNVDRDVSTMLPSESIERRPTSRPTESMVDSVVLPSGAVTATTFEPASRRPVEERQIRSPGSNTAEGEPVESYSYRVMRPSGLVS